MVNQLNKTLQNNDQRYVGQAKIVSKVNHGNAHFIPISIDVAMS